MLESVLVHEIAHQWFYNLIGNNQQMEPWLDEGYAQFATYLYYEEQYNDGSEYIESFKSRIDRIPDVDFPITKSVSYYHNNEYSPAIYGRAPLVIYEMYLLSGKAEYLTFLRRYCEEFRWKTITTESYKDFISKNLEVDFSDIYSKWF